MDSQTQWVPQGGLNGLTFMGLNYANVDVLLRRRDASPGVFDDILVLERAFLKALSEIPSP